MACILCHVFQALAHIFNSLSSKLQPKKTQESMKIESKDTDTEQPSAARSFVFPSKKKRVSAEKDPFFLVGARCARAFFFLRKFTFQKHQTVSQKIDCHFLRGVHFSKKSGKRSSWKRRLSRIRLFISRGSSAARSGSGLRREWERRAEFFCKGFGGPGPPKAFYFKLANFLGAAVQFIRRCPYFSSKRRSRW